MFFTADHATVCRHSARLSFFEMVQVLDLWVDSFNPEFIERSMAGVIRDLMLALWAHVQPHPYPHGTKVLTVQAMLQVAWYRSATNHLPSLLLLYVASTYQPAGTEPCRWPRLWASWVAGRGNGFWMA